MSQKSARKRLRRPQRKKPFRKERRKRHSHRRGRRNCIHCGRDFGVEKRLRRSVNDSLIPLRGLSTRCHDDCPCMLCGGGDMLRKAMLGERLLDAY